MTKYPMTKEARIPNDESPKTMIAAHLDFGLRHSFVIGSFVIRHSQKVSDGSRTRTSAVTEPRANTVTQRTQWPKWESNPQAPDSESGRYSNSRTRPMKKQIASPGVAPEGRGLSDPVEPRSLARIRRMGTLARPVYQWPRGDSNSHLSGLSTARLPIAPLGQ